MLGEWFYNQRIRKATAVFGTLFNNIYVVRKNSAGETISQIKVPLSYAPKRDFVDRIAKMESGENQERQISVKLPRMSFEINAFTYDATRQLPKINKRTIPSTEGASTAQKLYTPVPYTLSFQLHIYGRNQDDCLQIVEQILPYFTPQYNVSIKPLEGFDLQEDTPIKLEAVTFSDDFEAALENRRTIIYTLDFDMKITLYKGVPTASGTILDATANFYNYGTTDLLTSIQCLANQVTGNSSSITEDQGPATGTLKVTNTLNALYDSDQNVIGNPFSIESGDSADFGTAIVNSATGEWTYTPNGDFYGTDTFQIGVDVGQGVTEKFTVTVNVTSDDDDAITSNFTVFRNIPTIVDVSTNDTFETLNDVTYTIQTLPNSGGNLTIQDGSAGTFLYTAQSAVSPDFFEYRGLPEGGTAEVGEANVTILDALTYSVSVPNAIEGETINATITTNVANNQTLSWTITGDNTTNGRISTTSGTVVMDATTKQIPIVIGQPAGEQGTVQSTFTITDNSPQYPNTSYGTPPTASDTFDVLDTFPPEEFQAASVTADGDFGYAIDMTDTYIVIGEPKAGKAYVRTISDGTTVELIPSGGVTNTFGYNVAIDGNQVLVSAFNTSSGAEAVHVFDTDGNALAILTDPDFGSNRYGIGIGFTTDLIYVSASNYNTNGRIHFYDRTTYAITASKFNGANGQSDGTTVKTTPRKDQIITVPNKSDYGYVRLVSINDTTGANTNTIMLTHDNTASVWNSHYDNGNGFFTVAPTSVAASDNFIFIGAPNLNRVAVWRYADPARGNFGTLGATPTTPRVTGTFSVTNSGRNIGGMGTAAADLVSGAPTVAEAQAIPLGGYSGHLWNQNFTTRYSGKGGYIWIRNVATGNTVIREVSRDSTTKFPENIVWGNVEGLILNSSIPDFTGNGNYDLELSMVVQYSHRISAADVIQSPDANADVDFGRFLAVDGNELYVGAPLETWSGTQKGTIYRFTIDDTVDVGFDRTLPSDTVATLTGYITGADNEHLSCGESPTVYLFGDAVPGYQYTSSTPKQFAVNNGIFVLGNPEYSSNDGRVIVRPTFTSV